jgi:hypothetical protein
MKGKLSDEAVLEWTDLLVPVDAVLDESEVEACRRLQTRSLTLTQWKALWPIRTLFEQDFEQPPTEYRDWEGRIKTANMPANSRRALAGVSGNQHFARRTRTGICYDNARAAITTFLKFQYFVSKAVPIGILVFNMTRGDSWEYTITDPVVETWAEVRLNVTEQFRKKDGGVGSVEAGDALYDIFVHAGRPEDPDLILIADNLQLLGLDM